MNITSVNLADGTGDTTTMFLTLETRGLAQLSQILKKIDGVKGVISVSRVGFESPRPGAVVPTPAPVKEDAGLKKNQTEVNLGK